MESKFKSKIPVRISKVCAKCDCNDGCTKECDERKQNLAGRSKDCNNLDCTCAGASTSDGICEECECTEGCDPKCEENKKKIQRKNCPCKSKGKGAECICKGAKIVDGICKKCECTDACTSKCEENKKKLQSKKDKDCVCESRDEKASNEDCECEDENVVDGVCRKCECDGPCDPRCDEQKKLQSSKSCISTKSVLSKTKLKRCNSTDLSKECVKDCIKYVSSSSHKKKPENDKNSDSPRDTPTTSQSPKPNKVCEPCDCIGTCPTACELHKKEFNEKMKFREISMQEEEVSKRRPSATDKNELKEQSKEGMESKATGDEPCENYPLGKCIEPCTVNKKSTSNGPSDKSELGTGGNEPCENYPLGKCIEPCIVNKKTTSNGPSDKSELGTGANEPCENYPLGKCIEPCIANKKTTNNGPGDNAELKTRTESNLINDTSTNNLEDKTVCEINNCDNICADKSNKQTNVETKPVKGNGKSKEQLETIDSKYDSKEDKAYKAAIANYGDNCGCKDIVSKTQQVDKCTCTDNAPIQPAPLCSCSAAQIQTDNNEPICTCSSAENLSKDDTTQLEDNKDKSCICFDTQENDDYIDDVDELTSILDDIYCSCAKAENITEPFIKKASFFQSNESALQDTINKLYNKCTLKDQLIDSMVIDLKERTSSGIFEHLLKNLKRNDRNVPDFDRTQIANALTYAAPVASDNRELVPTSGNGMDTSGIGLYPFKIISVKRISHSSLLIKWLPPCNNLVTGYEIHINGKTLSVIYDKNRTATVLDTVNLCQTVQIECYAVTNNGICLPPAIAIYDI